MFLITGPKTVFFWAPAFKWVSTDVCHQGRAINNKIFLEGINKLHVRTMVKFNDIREYQLKFMLKY